VDTVGREGRIVYRARKDLSKEIVLSFLPFLFLSSPFSSLPLFPPLPPSFLSPLFSFPLLFLHLLSFPFFFLLRSVTRRLNPTSFWPPPLFTVFPAFTHTRFSAFFCPTPFTFPVLTPLLNLMHPSNHLPAFLLCSPYPLSHYQ